MFSLISNRAFIYIYIYISDTQWKFLGRCIGAGDGTHIPIRFVESDEVSPRFTNRSGEQTQNVLIIVNHDKTISAIRAMNAGSSYDGSVLNESGILDLIPGKRLDNVF